MSEDNNEIQNQNPNENKNEIQNPNETHEVMQDENQNQVQDTNKDENQDNDGVNNIKSEKPSNENEAEPVFEQTQSKAEITPSQQAPKPSLKDLKRQVAVLTVRIEDANQHMMVREENLRKSITDLTTQNALLRTHLKSLDHLIKKLSLLHSQLTAAPNYKLAKADVEEMIRLVSNL